MENKSLDAKGGAGGFTPRRIQSAIDANPSRKVDKAFDWAHRLLLLRGQVAEKGVLTSEAFRALTHAEKMDKFIVFSNQTLICYSDKASDDRKRILFFASVMAKWPKAQRLVLITAAKLEKKVCRGD